MDVQIFGTRKCSETRKALRFFKERRIQVHFVDLNERAASPGELRRFVQKFGVEAMIDRDGTRFRDLGLASAQRSESWWVDMLAEEPALLCTPLVRSRHRLTVGVEEQSWKDWMAGS